MGIWVRSQDKTGITFCKTVRVWENGRIVNSIGKEYIHLADYGSKERAKEVLDILACHIASGSKEVFEMPLN